MLSAFIGGGEENSGKLEEMMHTREATERVVTRDSLSGACSVAEAETGHSGSVPHSAENAINLVYRRHGWLGTQQ